MNDDRKYSEGEKAYWRVYANCMNAKRQMEDEAKKHRAKMRDVFVDLYYDLRSV